MSPRQSKFKVQFIIELAEGGETAVMLMAETKYDATVTDMKNALTLIPILYRT